IRPLKEIKQMMKYGRMVFDEFIPSTTAVYTANDFNLILGSADKLSFFAVADNVAGTSPTLTVQMEHSGDGRIWQVKNATAELNGASLTVGATNPTSVNPSVLFVGSDDGNKALMPFVRLRIQLAGSGSPAAHVKIYACGRDY